MCGHVGIISASSMGFFKKDVDAFKTLLYLDATRGEDATGVCFIDRDGSATVLKEASIPNYFFYNKEWQAELTSSIHNGRAILGHNRKATMGKSEDKQAHPFVIDKQVFFHNGTLSNHHLIKDTEVDSEALGWLLTNCHGDVDAIATALTKVDGAYACVWYDVAKDTVYMLRNNQRPLVMVETEQGDFMYASESWMIVAATVRENIKIKRFITINTDVLYSFNLSEKDCVLKEEPLPKKATAPQVTIGGPTFLTKAAKKNIKAMLTTASTLAFRILDIIPSNIKAETQDLDWDRCYDFLVIGSSQVCPELTFKTLLKDKFPHEMEMMLSQSMFITGFLDVMDLNGPQPEVWLKDVKVPFQATACH